MFRQPRRRLGPSEIKAAAAEFIRQDLRDAAAIQVVTQYAGTRKMCLGRFEQPELHDVHATLRRANIEGAFRATANMCEGVTHEIARNASKNAFYTRLRTGPFVLTQSAVESRAHVPRDAVFRATLASGQLDMFAKSDGASDDDAIFGVFIHGPRSINSAAPGFLMIGFPEADCSRYVTWVDLGEELSRATALVLGGQAMPSAMPIGQPLIPLGEEQVGDELSLHFREDVKHDKKKSSGDGA